MSARQKKWSGDTVSTTMEKPIITVKEARKLLGRDAIDLSNLEVQGMVMSLHKIADCFLAKI